LVQNLNSGSSLVLKLQAISIIGIDLHNECNNQIEEDKLSDDEPYCEEDARPHRPEHLSIHIGHILPIVAHEVRKQGIQAHTQVIEIKQVVEPVAWHV